MIFLVAIAVASDLRFEVAAIRVTKLRNHAQAVSNLASLQGTLDCKSCLDMGGGGNVIGQETKHVKIGHVKIDRGQLCDIWCYVILWCMECLSRPGGPFPAHFAQRQPLSTLLATEEACGLVSLCCAE